MEYWCKSGCWIVLEGRRTHNLYVTGGHDVQREGGETANTATWTPYVPLANKVHPGLLPEQCETMLLLQAAPQCSAFAAEEGVVPLREPKTRGRITRFTHLWAQEVLCPPGAHGQSRGTHTAWSCLPQTTALSFLPRQQGGLTSQSADEGLFKPVFSTKSLVRCLWRLLSQELITHPAGEPALRCARLSK